MIADDIDRYDQSRARMLEADIVGRGVSNEAVLRAMRKVPRHEFVRVQDRDIAYGDTPLPIGLEQTISQPYIVAAMIAGLELSGSERVLEVGAGSGYAAAILGQLVPEVWAVERLGALASEARDRLERLGYANVHVVHGDGTQGLPEHAPYDAILVSAGGSSLPPALLEQLAVGGRLIIPIGNPEIGSTEQRLFRYRNTGAGIECEPGDAVRFVPLLPGAS